MLVTFTQASPVPMSLFSRQISKYVRMTSSRTLVLIFLITPRFGCFSTLNDSRYSNAYIQCNEIKVS